VTWNGEFGHTPCRAKLTYRFPRRDSRPTDVHGKVIKDVLA
jgi:hypothetical protein